MSLRQSLNRSKTFISLYDGVANGYLTVTEDMEKFSKPLDKRVKMMFDGGVIRTNSHE